MNIRNFIAASFALLVFIGFVFLYSLSGINSAEAIVGACKVGGCSGEVCYDTSLGDIVSICLWKEEYACLKYAICERQPSGVCGWTQTNEYQACLGGVEPTAPPVISPIPTLADITSCGDLCEDKEVDDLTCPSCNADKGEVCPGELCNIKSENCPAVCPSTQPQAEATTISTSAGQKSPSATPTQVVTSGKLLGDEKSLTLLSPTPSVSDFLHEGTVSSSGEDLSLEKFEEHLGGVSDELIEEIMQEHSSQPNERPLNKIQLILMLIKKRFLALFAILL